MNEELKVLAAVSHSTRYAMLVALKKSFFAGLSTADLFEQVSVERNPVTLRHHLRRLVEAGVVESHKQGKGRTMVHTLRKEVLQRALVSFLYSLGMWPVSIDMT